MPLAPMRWMQHFFFLVLSYLVQTIYLTLQQDKTICLLTHLRLPIIDSEELSPCKLQLRELKHREQEYIRKCLGGNMTHLHFCLPTTVDAWFRYIHSGTFFRVDNLLPFCMKKKRRRMYSNHISAAAGTRKWRLPIFALRIFLNNHFCSHCFNCSSEFEMVLTLRVLKWKRSVAD